MSNDMKCPFCQQELRKIHPTYVICDNCRITGEDKLWQELIRTRKALKIASDCMKIMYDNLPDGNRWKWEIEKTLEQIKVEQKDK